MRRRTFVSHRSRPVRDEKRSSLECRRASGSNSELARLVGSVGGGRTKAEVRGCVVSWTQTYPRTVCGDSSAYFERSTTIDLNHIQTDPRRVRLYRRDGLSMIIWEYTAAYGAELREQNDLWRALQSEADQKSLSGWQRAAAISDAFAQRRGESLRSGRFYKYCSGGTSEAPLATLQFTMLVPENEADALLRLIDAHKEETCAGAG